MKRKEPAQQRPFTVTVPCSTANIGPGFDTLGVGLSMSMQIAVSFADQKGFTVSYEGDSPHTVPLDPERNLVTRTAIQVASSYGQLLPGNMHVKIINPDSTCGSAVPTEACGLGMDTQRILDYCLSIEGHPDNITASILGGLTLNQSTPNGFPNVPKFEAPASNLGSHLRLKISSKIKFVLQTKLARSDVIFNIQRVALDASVISEAMHDRVHQKYRQHLVPGLPDILKLTHKSLPWTTRVSASAVQGRLFLCLATDNFDKIGETGIKASYQVLEVSESGFMVSY
ncbi:hypothetical protein BJ741DRAFT_658375 [Chytriomyces cf. hyalinus JEL632]|nr:hypothetical protein BJ741DRAFT_658375 [Chytriomyces cf. hyalinus JEL632]